MNPDIQFADNLCASRWPAAKHYLEKLARGKHDPETCELSAMSESDGESGAVFNAWLDCFEAYGPTEKDYDDDNIARERVAYEAEQEAELSYYE